MIRIIRGNIARKNRKNILKIAKGYKGSHSKLFRVANQQVMKAFRYSYIGRIQKKRNFRELWIKRVNAGVRLYGLKYSKYLNYLKTNGIALNRKMLSQIVILDPFLFKNIIYWIFKKCVK
jgi:large subunit ribosomal protein L20